MCVSHYVYVSNIIYIHHVFFFSHVDVDVNALAIYTDMNEYLPNIITSISYSNIKYILLTKY